MLTTAATARACLELANRTLGERPLIDSMGVRLDSQALDGVETTINLVFSDLDHVDRGDIEVDGDDSVPSALFGGIVEFRLFPIVEP